MKENKWLLVITTLIIAVCGGLLLFTSINEPVSQVNAVDFQDVVDNADSADSSFSEIEISDIQSRIELMIINDSKYQELGGKNLIFKNLASELYDAECMGKCDMFYYAFETENNETVEVYVDVNEDFGTKETTINPTFDLRSISGTMYDVISGEETEFDSNGDSAIMQGDKIE